MDKETKGRLSKQANKNVKMTEAYHKVFNSAEGQLVLSNLMSMHGMLSPTYGGKVHDMLHKEGERNVVLRILKILGTNPKDLRERIEDHEKSLAE